MDYNTKITESLAELQQLEKQQTNATHRDHIRFIRLLKEQKASTQQQAATLLNLSLRQAQRLWRTYQQGGLSALIPPPKAAYIGKLSFVQISQLRQFLLDDQAQTLADIQAYLAGSHGVQYTLGGLCDLCKRLGIKPKTGRPVHYQQAPGALEAFKKNG
ncbi:helix-turn-helix domain-containing protein [Spirosoma foliorum]|uniref:Winged helix-turn-helix domain-containing protein n=1 Tax=Spirosoma foliorum TaxID=2710596 RepID=A0A7G5H1B1_9BACT|nr:winged helix-turn-helix domain-containing protein [Spirosoma foliorum]QMW04903.1 winged helix-turn-helix domain-containing protein [Spirosoma foliorum]